MGNLEIWMEKQAAAAVCLAGPLSSLCRSTHSASLQSNLSRPTLFDYRQNNNRVTQLP